MRRILRRPSPAMAVALTALFVALGGTSYVSAQTGTTTTPSATPTVPVARAVFADTAGAASIQRVEYVTESDEMGGDRFARVHVSCPEGLNVIGGGAHVENQQNDFVNDAGPVGDDAYSAHGFSLSSSDKHDRLFVTAICAEVGQTRSDH